MFDEKRYRAEVRRRADVAFEDESARRVLEAVGRLDLVREITQPRKGSDWPVVRMAAFYTLPEFEFFPMRLELRARKCKHDEPGLDVLLRSLGRQFPDTYVIQCLARDYDARKCQHRSVGIVFPYDDDVVIAHNRPDWTEGSPIQTHDCQNGCVLAMHHFEPFIEDVAEECRGDMANDEQMELIESNADWRQTSWRDYE